MKAAVVSLALLALCATTATSAHAQGIDELAGQGSGSFDLERLRPALGRDGILDVESGAIGGGGDKSGDFDAALWLNGSFAPLTFTNAAGGKSAIVSDRASAHLLGNFILSDSFALGVELPVVVWQNGPALVPGIAGKNQVAAIGLDDLRVVPKLALLSSKNGAPLDLALAVHATLPTSVPRHQFIGDGLPTLEPELDASTALGPVKLALDLGAKLRAASRFGGAVQGSELTGRVGASLDFKSLIDVPMSLDATINGAYLPLDAPTSPTNNPVEGLLGLGFDVGPVHLFAAAGTALVGAPGTPAFRGLAGLRWSPRCDDPDGDGVCVEVDRCPNEHEDVDGVDDGDGCVDADVVAAPAAPPAPVDTDGDGIRDLDDVCPAVAEDPDGAMDNDGCPGADEDNDGLLDGIDRCPSDPESKNNIDDGDGCPEVPVTELRGIKRDTVPLGGAVSFVPKTSKLDANGMLALDTAIAYLKNTNENVRIDVAFPDIDATAPNANKEVKRIAKLNDLRETAIKKYLVKNGVAAKRVLTKGQGDIDLKVRAD